MTRKEEINSLLFLSEDEVIEKAGKHLQVYDSCDGIHLQIAEDMAEIIKLRNSQNKATKLILPVGPVGQYSIFLDLIHRENISLKKCFFFYMDENADDSDKALSTTHPLSFQGEVRKLWLDKVDKELAIPEEQLFFPSHDNINTLADKIKSLGGIDICFGGIGIHGHIAFNEPERGVKNSNPRLVHLNDFTLTINAIRSKVGGNLEGTPKKAYTLGLKQILESKKICLACRNGIELDWANTVLRLVLFGKSDYDYPCTYVNQHNNFVIYTDKDTLKQPEVLL